MYDINKLACSPTFFSAHKEVRTMYDINWQPKAAQASWQVLLIASRALKLPKRWMVCSSDRIVDK